MMRAAAPGYNERVIGYWGRGAATALFVSLCFLFLAGPARADESYAVGPSPIVRVSMTAGKVTIATSDSPQVSISTNGTVDVQHLGPNDPGAQYPPGILIPPQSAQTESLVRHLRSDVVPPVTQATGASAYIGGVTAAQIDFSHVLASKLWLFIGIVVLLSALLLLVVFRSVLIPVQAAVMNLLSIGASMGVVVAVFQWGWLGSLLGIGGGPIFAFLPVMVFAIVFGLSMDYEVFLVSRIHEEWVHGADSSTAVREGVSRTGRVITAAAAVMVAVFASFMLGGERVIEMFGLGLASAVFLDALVVRCILLPAVLELLGRHTWRFPSSLDRWLPRLAIEPQPAVVAQLPAD